MIDEASGIMLDFAGQTGLGAATHPPRRYLWTDAHAVCNFLGLYRAAGRRSTRSLGGNTYCHRQPPALR